MTKFLDQLGVLFGPKCEIVVHDFSEGYDHTVVHIVNGEVSGRELGDCPTNLFFERLERLEDNDASFEEYYSIMDDGRVIRSSSTVVRDGENKPVGAVCINVDITDILQMNRFFQPLIGGWANGEQKIKNEKFVRNVQELLDVYLSEAERMIGKPGTEMNREEKLRALAYLDERGAFQISKAHVRLCEFFGVSKYTLYNYLDSIRSLSDAGPVSEA